MKPIFRRLLAVLAIAVTSSVTFVDNSNAAEYLVKYKNSKGRNHIMGMALTSSLQMNVMDKNDTGQYVLVDINEQDLAANIADLTASVDVEWIVPNFKLYALRSPMQSFEVPKPATREQWALQKIRAENAWQRAQNKGLKSVIMAVIDTGVDYRHESLAPNMIAGYDFRNNDNDPMDETSSKNPGHGTHCAGIAAATGLVANGISGMGANVTIMPLRFLGSDGSGDLNAAIKAIDYAVEHGASVISASWGATVPRSQATALIEAIQRADDKGVIFVAAAANDGKNNDETEVFPANSATPNMIAVAASTSSDQKPSWSNYGKAMVSLASPGEKIISTLPGNKYGELSGTSMATPLVSGLVSFLKAQNTALTGAEIRSLLQTTGAKVNIETACNCRIDAFNAVDTLLNSKAWLVPAAITVPVQGTSKVTMFNGKAPFKFVSSQPNVMTVDGQGNLTGVAEGTAQITVTDANGVSMQSLDFNVANAKSGGGGDCPLGDPQLCDALCGIFPDLPICLAP